MHIGFGITHLMIHSSGLIDNEFDSIKSHVQNKECKDHTLELSLSTETFSALFTCVQIFFACSLQLHSEFRNRTLCSMYPREISLENLEKLEKIFSQHWPKHAVVASSLKSLSQLLEKFPELTSNLKLFVLSDKWEVDGGFYAIVSGQVFEIPNAD